MYKFAQSIARCDSVVVADNEQHDCCRVHCADCFKMCCSCIAGCSKADKMCACQVQALMLCLQFYSIQCTVHSTSMLSILRGLLFMSLYQLCTPTRRMQVLQTLRLLICCSLCIILCACALRACRDTLGLHHTVCVLNHSLTCLLLCSC
jgi:hypothetical protein